MIDGLAQVVQAPQLSNLAKARWLQQPHPLFGGSTPLDLLRQGRLEDVLAEAAQVGRGQDCAPRPALRSARLSAGRR